MYPRLLKPAIDIVIGALILLALSPLWILVFLLIPLDSRGPIFFKQERVGKGLKPIYVLKFRTMTHEKREVGSTPVIGRAEGVTRVGYYLRRFKIDELPQLWSVVRGELSLVGPRPSVPQQLAQMTPEQKSRYDVRPGLTGLAQVSGNIHMSWEKRFIKDLEYKRNISFWNDLRILIRTVQVILKGEAYFLDKPLKLDP